MLAVQKDKLRLTRIKKVSYSATFNSLTAVTTIKLTGSKEIVLRPKASLMREAVQIGVAKTKINKGQSVSFPRGVVTALQTWQ